ncbi:cation transporter dimerization domain-containing protein [Desulfosarcina sp.]|uniref:NifB/NifX family molybdenum-iron cluster-binding protein n=1 Tax=Desulfosarcina sp. TaxID=2027861 RepID=UPI0029BEE849|nr:cation transporter dimerization domain-containing protein [Desulfosarcina sp.]MDX2490318.1 cation transporter dimerization domain-containing protein [Desulfosarcina sp.]
MDYQTLSLAEKLIVAEPRVISIQNLMGRNSGRYKFIEANILLKVHELDKASFIANRIAGSISERIKNVDRVLIHYEPIKKENLIYALPLEDDLQQQISDHFGEAPYFGLTTVCLNDNKAIGQEILANPFTQVEHGKGILVAEFLIRHSVDVVVTKESFAGKGPFYVFSSAAVKNVLTREDTAEKALAHLGVRYV